MVRFTKFLQIIEEEKLVENAAKVGGYFFGRLRELESEFPHLIFNTAASVCFARSTC